MDETPPTEPPVLNQTPTASSVKMAEAKPRFDPTLIFVQKDKLVWFWFGFAMLILAAAAVDRYFLVQSFKQRERVVIIDPSNTFYVSPLLKFSEAKGLHVEQSTLAATSFLERNPNGFDNPDLLKQIFLKQAYQNAATALTLLPNEPSRERDRRTRSTKTTIIAVVVAGLAVSLAVTT